MSEVTDPTDTQVAATIVDDQVYVSAADLAAKFAEVAHAMDQLGPAMCLATGNDSATLFAGWAQMMADLANMTSDETDEPVSGIEFHVDEGDSDD